MKIAKPDEMFPDDVDFMETNEFPVVFKWHANNPAKHVYVTGSWDSWKRKVPLVKSTHDFSTILNLNPGSFVCVSWIQAASEKHIFHDRIEDIN